MESIGLEHKILKLGFALIQHSTRKSYKKYAKIVCGVAIKINYYRMNNNFFFVDKGATTLIKEQDILIELQKRELEIYKTQIL